MDTTDSNYNMQSYLSTYVKIESIYGNSFVCVFSFLGISRELCVVFELVTVVCTNGQEEHTKKHLFILPHVDFYYKMWKRDLDVLEIRKKPNMNMLWKHSTISHTKYHKRIPTNIVYSPGAPQSAHKWFPGCFTKSSKIFLFLSRFAIGCCYLIKWLLSPT